MVKNHKTRAINLINQLLDEAKADMAVALAKYHSRGIWAVAIVVDLKCALGRRLSTLMSDKRHHPSIDEAINDHPDDKSTPWALLIADPVSMVEKICLAGEALGFEHIPFDMLVNHFGAAPKDGEFPVGAIGRDPDDPTGRRVATIFCWA